jgi:transposase InsO family protein
MWKQLGRERLRGARCRVRPLMRDMGLAASRTKSVASEDETRRPTIRRAKTSMTTAPYTNPRQVATYVKSDTQS